METNAPATLDSRIVEGDLIIKEVGPEIDKALAEASRIAASIVDEPSRERAIAFGQNVRDVIAKAQSWRERFYVPVRDAAKNLANSCDPRIKQGNAILELLSSGVSRYDIEARRKAQLEKERVEAEARRVQAEADRLQREAAAAEAKAKQAAEDEKRRLKEAQEAEARRVQAEADAQARKEEEARRVEREERERKQREEQEARLAHAQEAQRVGNTDRVENILDRATPIAPVVANPTTAASQEALKIEQDLAAKAAAEKALAEAKQAKEAAERQQAANEEARLKAEEAQKAADVAAAATAAAAAAQAVTARRPDDRMKTTVTWKWALDGDPKAAFSKLVKAVAEGRAPMQYLGFDPDAPEKFRPKDINADVTKLKDSFKCDGLIAYCQEDKVFLKTKPTTELA